MNLKQYLEQKKVLAEKILDEYLDNASTKPAIIHEAMRYSVFNGGKRLRPALVFLGNKLFNGKEIDAYPCAVAVELIHCYSLVHDDLPALDNDDYRRGKLTCHKKFSEEIAILAGDALLTKAFEVLAEAKNANLLIKELAQAAGSQGMIGGQVMDLECENKTKTVEALEYIHKNKTSKLIESSLVLGALSAGAANVDNLRNYGECLGLMFQITDDILDITADKEKLGKRGSDLDNNKLTYPALFGLEASRKIVEDLRIKGKEAINDPLFHELLDYVASRSY